MESVDQFELTKDFLERFGEAIETQDSAFILESLEGVNPADVTSLLHEFSGEQSKYVLDLLPLDTSAEILKTVKCSFLQ